MPLHRHWLALCPLLLLTLPLLAQTAVDRRVDAAPDGVVQVELLAGSLTVRGWDRAEVRVKGTLGRGMAGIDLERRGDTVSLEVDHRGHHRHKEAQLEIFVPASSRLDLETLSADITLDGLAGAVEASTVSGRVEGQDLSGALEIETVSGSIDLNGGKSLRLETVSGRLNVLTRALLLELETVSGRVDLVAKDVERGSVSTVSANLDLSLSLRRDADLELSSHSGHIALRFPESTSATFKVETYSGDISNQHGPKAQRVGAFGPEKALDFSLRDGRGRVEIETFSGDVELLLPSAPAHTEK